MPQKRRLKMPTKSVIVAAVVVVADVAGGVKVVRNLLAQLPIRRSMRS